LAFARKQTIAPKVLDLNETVEGMLTMLRRLIGEDIDLVWMPGSGLWSVKVDPSQIDQILANLCINARAAIAGVGKITVMTENCTLDEYYSTTHTDCIPGMYVRITVSDSGCGMDKTTLAHIFEPFFTTKGVGEGTGLGLATVFGAVKQNNGIINVYSEPGQGTSFAIHLPRYFGNAQQSTIALETEPAAHGHETILLVEDEPTILGMTVRMLERLGYTVLAASSPEEAMRLVAEFVGEVYMLMTDVVMPGMNGRDLADRLLKDYPTMKCLFMSGYTANIITNQGVLSEGMNFIQKPFSRKELAARVRQVMESEEGEVS
jgi:CheY-like chemotaxis protein